MLQIEVEKRKVVKNSRLNYIVILKTERVHILCEVSISTGYPL